MIRSKHWLVAAALALSGTAHADPICNLVFDKCPKPLAGSTVNVPGNVIWLDAKLPACTDSVLVQKGGTANPPSIMFIIDNSGSMSAGDGTNQPDPGWTDPTEARFTVTKTLLDSIARVSPTAEVGLVIFTRRLQFDHRENPLFLTAFPGDTSQHDSYVPLMPLNKTFANGVSALDTLKALLAYTGHGNLKYATKLPASRQNGYYDANDLRNGTDITLGFEAAKLAMKAARAEKPDQYFIFLSDGEPSRVDKPRESIIDNFKAQSDAPTTFTFFFKAANANPTVPAAIREMTDYIARNNYSASNPKSAYWSVNQPSTQLIQLIQEHVLNPIFANAPAKAIAATMNVGGKDYPAVPSGTGFAVPARVPLAGTGTTTPITLGYTYQYTNDSGKAATKDGKYAITIQRGAAGTPLPAGVSAACQEQGSLALYSKDTPVNLVTADHADLDVHLTLANGETCNGCKVEVKPSKSADRENVTLVPAGPFQKGNFGRETSAQAVPGDGKLEHLPGDSIIITYVNPDNPLDVIRKAYPYSDVSTQLTVSKHNDVAKGGDLTTDAAHQFVLVTPAALNATTGEAKNWSVVNTLSAADSVRYVGNVIRASRAFKVEVEIYSNLGQFVNKIAFTVPQSEFAKLARDAKGSTRQLRVLWNNRTRSGNPAGTGAYIMKTTVTLLRIPGVAEDEAVSTDFRIVGVLRE
jgi:hypothetical protein